MTVILIRFSAGFNAVEPPTIDTIGTDQSHSYRIKEQWGGGRGCGGVNKGGGLRRKMLETEKHFCLRALLFSEIEGGWGRWGWVA